MKLRIFALVLLIYKTLCSYTVENTVSSCINYEANTSYKWCRNSTTFDSGFACSISDYSNVCGGSTSYRCSINNSYLPQNSKKLLCPIDTTSCNSQIMKLETNSSSVSVTSNYFSTGTLCWYRFYPSDNTTKSISVYAKSLFSAKAEVYVESSSNSFSYQGSILFGDSMNVTLNSIVPVWVLVTPSSSNSYVSMTATTSPYYYVSSSSMPVLLIVLISILSFCCCFLFFIIIPMVLCSLCFKKEKNRKQRRAQYIENSTPTTDVNKKYKDDDFDINPKELKFMKRVKDNQLFSIPQYPIQSNDRDSSVHMAKPKVIMSNRQLEFDPAYPVTPKQDEFKKKFETFEIKI